MKFLGMQFDYGFRIDFGGDVGSGHFYRCYAIAEKLIEKKFKVVFIVNSKEEIKLHSKNKKIFSDLLFNGSIVNQFQKYLINKNKTQYFKGPKFILLRSEFSVNKEKFNINKVAYFCMNKAKYLCKKPKREYLILFLLSSSFRFEKRFIVKQLFYSILRYW